MIHRLDQRPQPTVSRSQYSAFARCGAEAKAQQEPSEAPIARRKAGSEMIRVPGDAGDAGGVYLVFHVYFTYFRSFHVDG